jgi:hypothetical protein
VRRRVITASVLWLSLSASTAFGQLLCHPPYTRVDWLIQGAAPKPTYCGSIRESRVESTFVFFGLGALVHTISLPDAQRLAGFPLYFPAHLPPWFRYAQFYAAIQAPGSSNEHRSFETKRNFLNGYFNYEFFSYSSGLDFFLLSAADAAMLGDEGVFHCPHDRTVDAPPALEFCSGHGMARWWSPDHAVLIAAKGAVSPGEFVAIANSMTPLDGVGF